MIKPDQLNHITVAPVATVHEWMGIFIGVPSKDDVINAMRHHIDRLVEGEVEHEQDEAEYYRIALQVLRNSHFDLLEETVSVAGVQIGEIRCDRLDCFDVT